MERKGIALALLLGAALGATPAYSQRTIKITWQASPDAAGNPSLTYNVYRASSCGGQFSKLNSAGISATSYVDPSVATGAAYCYQVTAVLNGAESVPSNQAFAKVPPLANRQATCEHRGPLIGWIRCIGMRPKRPTPRPVAP
jgi:fibronectin type 3 domain-containing protein